MKRGDILFFLIATSILVFAWIGFSIYHNLAKSTISETLGTQITPIKSDFDAQIIDQLKKRKQVIPILEIGEGASSPSASPTPTQTGTQQATGGARL